MSSRIPAFRGLVLASLALGLTACGGGEARLRFTSNDSTVSLSNAWVQPTSQPVPSTVIQSSDGTTFTLTRARLYMRDVRLGLPKGKKCTDVLGKPTVVTCEGSDDAKTLIIPGPIVVDLMAGTAIPHVALLTLPAGTYQRLDYHLLEATRDDVGSAEPLLGYTFLASADFTQDGVTRKLEMSFKLDEDARIESATGVEVPDGGSLVVFFNPQVWLEGLPLGECIRDGDVEVVNDTVRIDDKASGRCSGAEALVKSNIKRSGELRKSEAQ